MDKSLGESRRGRITKALLVVVVLLSGLMWVSLNVWTVPVGLVWHMFHRDFVSFDGRQIRVPWDMWVNRSDDKTLMMMREAPTYPFLHSPEGTILIQRDPGIATNMSRDYDRISRANEQPPNGYRLQGVHRILSEKGTIYCWDLARIDTSYLSISCWFDKDTLAASYGGSPVYRERFYRVLDIVSGVPSQPNP